VLLSRALPDLPQRLVLTFGVITICAAAFSIWVFRVIESQQRDLQQSATLLDSVTDYAIVMLDGQGCISTWSAGAERLHGYTAAEVIGQSFEMFYPPDERAAGEPQVHLKDAADRGHIEYEGWRIRKDGSRFWSNVTITAVRDGEGRLLGYSKVSRDRTEPRRAQEQIEQLNASLQQRIAELGEA